MSEQKFPICIKTDLYNSGCLPVLLRREIALVEREMGKRFLDIEVAMNLADYHAQLQKVMVAVEEARRVSE